MWINGKGKHCIKLNTNSVVVMDAKERCGILWNSLNVGHGYIGSCDSMHLYWIRPVVHGLIWLGNDTVSLWHGILYQQAV